MSSSRQRLSCTSPLRFSRLQVINYTVISQEQVSICCSQAGRTFPTWRWPRRRAAWVLAAAWWRKQRRWRRSGAAGKFGQIHKDCMQFAALHAHGMLFLGVHAFGMPSKSAVHVLARGRL